MVTPVRRRSKNRQSLNVWMNGQLAGTWHVYKQKPQQFRYAESWLHSPHRRVLSLSMPFQPGNAPVTGDVVESFFDNLLPDSKEIRRRIQQNYGASGSTPFDLLAEVGRDCVGAIQLLHEDEEPEGWNSITARPLTAEQVEQYLRAATTARLAGEVRDEFRISIAGAQEKTALLWHEGQWHAPIGVTPTTHIMKLPLGLVGNMYADMSISVENEWLCSKIMQAYGIPVARCDMAMFGETKALVVERFDRKSSIHGKYWLRLPQEDMCQALGKPPELKYESDGGPGMSDLLRLLRGSATADQDRRTFYKTQILFWMLAATDGHAKNFSLFHEAGGTYRMTPIYDVLSTWPIMGEKANQLSRHKARLAMAFRSRNEHYKLKDIHPRHFYSVAKKLGLGGEVDGIIEEILADTPKVIGEVSEMLPEDFPAIVTDKVFSGLQESAEIIQRAI
ncbi:type II toxin-antitoxin system HipA family toxin [Mariprofundus erugo]|uniref:Type II toxin-antitoxin system HipA family toxin n=1 Tax=Mariprofundus erugo TaxID=2528639 RepID=A0A5R9GIV1_9PROT|nr:type II toxin-antitoxin system HipA family toxin [Mariprofundus erugo]TLS66190.1 type II toxin-antitoxin system HipA family toxin [Mariprofundus erugo]